MVHRQGPGTALYPGGYTHSLGKEAQNQISCDHIWERRNLKHTPTYVNMYMHRGFVLFCFNTPPPKKGPRRVLLEERTCGLSGRRILFHFMISQGIGFL